MQQHIFIILVKNEVEAQQKTAKARHLFQIPQYKWAYDAAAHL